MAQVIVKMSTLSTAQGTRRMACVLILTTWTMSRRSASTPVASVVSAIWNFPELTFSHI